MFYLGNGTDALPKLPTYLSAYAITVFLPTLATFYLHFYTVEKRKGIGPKRGFSQELSDG